MVLQLLALVLQMAAKAILPWNLLQATQSKIASSQSELEAASKLPRVWSERIKSRPVSRGRGAARNSDECRARGAVVGCSTVVQQGLGYNPKVNCDGDTWLAGSE